MSSPHEEDYHTGISSLNPQEALHSTENFGYTDREQWPSTWNRQMQRHQLLNDDETEASIEQGRGIQPTVESMNDDISSNIIFDFGGDSQYEVSATPSITNRRASTKIEDGLRKQVLQRKANEGAKRSVSHNALPSALRQKEQKIVEDNISATLSTNPKNTRFTRVKPRAVSATTQSAQPRANLLESSIQLPDITGIGELINGPDGTPQFSTKLRQPNTRFQPAKRHTSFARTADVDRMPLQNVPIPEDEKKIYQSLQTLQQNMETMQKKLASTEKQRDQALARLASIQEDNEELKQALDMSQKRVTQQLYDEEEQALRRWTAARTKVKADTASLQQRLEQTERDLHESEGVKKQLSKEKEELLSQVGLAVYRMEEVEAVNDTLYKEHEKLLRKNNDLQKINGILQQEIDNLRAGVHPKSSKRVQTETHGLRDSIHVPTRNTRTKQTRQAVSMGELDQQARHAIAEVVREQLFHPTQSKDVKRSSNGWITGTMTSQARQPIYAQRVGQKDEATATEFEITGRLPTQNFTNTRTDEITNITQPERADSHILRKSLEEKRRSSHLQRNVSAPLLGCNATQQQTEQLTRRSSMKEVFGADNTSKAHRTVRVQSPEAEEEEEDVIDIDNSMISNIGRRRRSSAAREEGETSAFIIPDITINRPVSRAGHVAVDPKHAKDCTVCAAKTGKQINIPAIVSVSERSDLPADATLRPAEAEESALARVKKQCEDELAHLKFDLTQLESEYHRHEPAVGARRRQELNKEISRLRALCELKAGQIYAMQDLFEAQKQREQQSLPVQGRGIAQKVTIQDEDDDEDDFEHETRAKPISAQYGLNRGFGMDGADDIASLGLPEWDGLSNDGA